MSEEPVFFETIDLDQEADECIQIVKDQMECSFGSDWRERFIRDCGPEGEIHLEKLQEWIASFPDGCVNVINGEQVIGQIIAIPQSNDPSFGHVVGIWVKREFRGTGVSNQIDEYVTRLFLNHGIAQARLFVVPTNHRAIRFYEKHGWKDVGPRDNDPALRVMQKTFAEALPDE